VFFLALAALLPLIALCFGYATLHEPYRPVFRRHRVRVPASWPGLSVLHISDLHVRRSDLRLYRAQKAALRGLEPDLLCVTGDVCEKVADIDLVIDLLQTVKPRLGTFIVLGNHEHNAPLPPILAAAHRRGWRRVLSDVLKLFGPPVRSDGDEEGHAMAEALQAAGLTVLHNDGVRVVDGTRSLWIGGCDSAWAGHADMVASMTGRRPGEACLSLIHEPDLAFDAHDEGADLILAGHTHGGQVRLPLLGAPYTHRMDDRIGIAAGFQAVGAGLLHITSGLGHTIPLRFRCPPEVAWLECEPQAVHQSLVA
jgi:predicted MPP superfamily phosphohydrolase